MAAPIPDITLLRRSCAPCTLRQFCQQAGLPQRAPTASLGKAFGISRGDSLFRTGDTHGRVYAVRSGALKTIALTADGEEHVLGFHLPGELLGLDSLATGVHYAEAVALSDTQVCELPVQGILNRSAAVPELGARMLQVLGTCAMDSRLHVDLLLRRQADERVAMFLHDLLTRYGREGARSSLMLPMSREDVGRYLGLALETVSRSLTRLQEDSLIEVSGRSVRVIDEERLRRMAMLPDTPSGPPLERQA
jgi:CRP/FNR family transcriptional regulator, anaerobic regulatory protein